MKTNQTAGKCVLAGMLAYLLIQIYFISYYIIPSVPEEAWEDLVCLFLVQSVFFAVCIVAVLIFGFLQQKREEEQSPFASLLIISGEGKIKREVPLQGKRSFLITGKKNGKEVFIETVQNSEAGRYLYGICNLIHGQWYFEAVPGSRLVGLKRGAENIVYKLKAEVLYQLFPADVIYAGTCKIVMRKQKNTWEE